MIVPLMLSVALLSAAQDPPSPPPEATAPATESVDAAKLFAERALRYQPSQRGRARTGVFDAKAGELTAEQVMVRTGSEALLAGEQQDRRAVWLSLLPAPLPLLAALVGPVLGAALGTAIGVFLISQGAPLFSLGWGLSGFGAGCLLAVPTVPAALLGSFAIRRVASADTDTLLATAVHEYNTRLANELKLNPGELGAEFFPPSAAAP